MRAIHVVLAVSAGAFGAFGCTSESSNDDGSGGAAGSAALTGGHNANGGNATSSGGQAGTAGSSPAAGGSKGGGGSAGDGAGGASGGGGASSGADSRGGVAGNAEGGKGTGGSSGAAAGGSAGGSGLANPVPSDGCDLAAASTADGKQTFEVDGSEREFIIRLPPAYDGKAPHRIVFVFHGAAGSADQVDKGDPPNTGLDPTGPYYGIKEHADDRTIFVAGQANGSWGNADIAYAETLVAKLSAELCLDESRMFATGFSMGGIMTVRVACNLPQIFRAVAPMSCSLSAANCAADGDPVAYWSSHGEEDPAIGITNGEAARDEFVDRNGCDANATPAPVGTNGCVAYEGCDDGYPVQWCPFTGIHEPPPFSGPEIWSFFSRF